MSDLRFNINANDLLGKSLENDIKKAERLRDILNDINKKKSGIGGGGLTNGSKDKGGSLAGIGSGFSRGIGMAGAFGVAGSIAIATRALIDFEKGVISALKNYENFHTSIVAMMNGRVNVANLLENKLVDFAKNSPFNLEEVQASTKMMLAYGFSVKEVIPQLKVLGDVAAGSGTRLKDLVYVQGTLKSQMQVYKRDLNQLTGRGINVIPTLVEQLNLKNPKDLFAQIKDGKVFYQDIERALTTMTQKGGIFFKQMDEASRTIGGRLERLNEGWTQVQVNMGKMQKGFLAESINFASTFVDHLNTALITINKLDSAITNFNKNNKLKLDFKTGDETVNSLFDLITLISMGGDKTKASVFKALLDKNDKKHAPAGFRTISGYQAGLEDRFITKSKIADFNEYPTKEEIGMAPFGMKKILEETKILREQFSARKITSGKLDKGISKLKSEQQDYNIKTIKQEQYDLKAEEEQLARTYEQDTKRDPKKAQTYADIFLKKITVLGAVKSQVDAKLEALTMNPASGGKDDDDGRGVKTGLHTTTGRQDLTINIYDGLIKQQTIQTTTLNESTEEIKEQMSRVLLEVVNDVNSIAKNR